MIIIINEGSRLIHAFCSHLRERGIPHLVFPHTMRIDNPFPKFATGLVLSGGPGRPDRPAGVDGSLDLRNVGCALIMAPPDLPTIGFCLGAEVIAHYYGGEIGTCDERQDRIEDVRVVRPDPIFEGLPGVVRLCERHLYMVTRLPIMFETLAESDACPHEAFRHYRRPIYGFQSHPEFSGPDGLLICDNFLAMCGYPRE